MGPASEDSAEPGAMIADGCSQAALEERVVELGLSCVRVRQLQRRAEDALRAETPANLALAAGG